MVRIGPIGRFWRLDADGFIQNDAAPEKILLPYSALVAEVRDAYLQHLVHDQATFSATDRCS